MTNRTDTAGDHLHPDWRSPAGIRTSISCASRIGRRIGHRSNRLSKCSTMGSEKSDKHDDDFCLCDHPMVRRIVLSAAEIQKSRQIVERIRLTRERLMPASPILSKAHMVLMSSRQATPSWTNILRNGVRSATYPFRRWPRPPWTFLPYRPSIQSGWQPCSTMATTDAMCSEVARQMESSASNRFTVLCMTVCFVLWQHLPIIEAVTSCTA